MREHGPLTGHRCRSPGREALPVAWLLSLAAVLAPACSGSGLDGPCRGVECGEGGFCFSDGERTYCACPAGQAPYGDDRCSPVSGCDGISCSGHGRCAEHEGTATGCDCDPGHHATPDGFHCLPLTPTDGDADTDVDADVDADSDADGDADADEDLPPRVGFVDLVGTATCGETESLVTVGDGHHVAVGEALLVRIGIRAPEDATPIMLSDSVGNVYRRDGSAAEAGQSLVEVWSAPVLRALSAGDVITVTHPAGRAVGVAVERFEGIAAAEPLEGLDTRVGSTAILDAAVETTSGETLLYAASTNVNHLSLEQDRPFTPLLSFDASCGGAVGNGSSHGAWTVAADPGVHDYRATLSASDHWALVLVAYRTR